MFRVEVHEVADHLLIKIEGRLAGDYAQDARSKVTCSETGVRRVIDLNELTSIDGEGEEVLLMLNSSGAEFITDNAYSRYLCERLSLSVLRSASPSRKSSKTPQ